MIEMFANVRCVEEKKKNHIENMKPYFGRTLKIDFFLGFSMGIYLLNSKEFCLVTRVFFFGRIIRNSFEHLIHFRNEREFASNFIIIHRHKLKRE